jgi:regulatory protein
MTKSSLQKLEDQVALIEAPSRPKQTISLLGRAIRYLSYRDHSESELIKKIRPFAQSKDELDEVIKKLKDKDFLSNARFAESLVLRKSRSLGSGRLLQEMKQHQLDTQIIQKHIKELKESESVRAMDVWQKKFGFIATEPKDIAKQIRFLVSRGFDQEIVYKIIRGKTLDESN